MALYLVSRTDSVDYDEFDALVIRAKNEKEALKIATARDPYSYEQARAEYQRFAADGSNAKVEKIAVTGKSEVILGSFNAG
jgi:hypothetical protein